MITHLEADGDYSSIKYTILVSVAANGVALAVASLLTIYKRVNSECDGQVK